MAPLMYASFDEFMSSDPMNNRTELQQNPQQPSREVAQGAAAPKKKKKKERKDPLCSLYQQQYNPGKVLDSDFLSLLDEDEMLNHSSGHMQSPYKRYGGKSNSFQRVEAEEGTMLPPSLPDDGLCRPKRRLRPSRHNIEALDGFNWNSASNLYDLQANGDLRNKKAYGCIVEAEDDDDDGGVRFAA